MIFQENLFNIIQYIYLNSAVVYQNLRKTVHFIEL